MELDMRAGVIFLEKGRFASLHDAQGSRIRCLAGSVWITQENDTRDTVLKAGDEFVLDRPGLALLSACGHASVAVADPGREEVAATDAAPVRRRPRGPALGGWSDVRA